MASSDSTPDTATAEALRRLATPTEEGDFTTALGLLEQAMAAGSGAAAHQLAVIAAIGIGAPPDWGRALGLLGHAADLGFAAAQAQLRLLSGHDGADWQAMARAIDVTAWLTPPARRNLCESPRVRAVDGFVSPAVCDWLVAAAADRLAPARTYSETGDARYEQGRTNTEADFNIAQTDMVLVLLRARIAAAVSLPVATMELTKVLHYQPGQRFNRHFDCLSPDLEGHAAEIAARGQRLVTFLLYLNDDYEGGETEFLHPGLRHRGAKGSGMYFANVDLAGGPDRNSLHQGLAPTRGEKWLLSQWIRSQPQ